MFIAGEASGDLLAAELVAALREELQRTESRPTLDLQPLRTGLAPRFFGAGGPSMKAAGVDLAFDLTQHSVIGLSDVLQHYLKFRRFFDQLFHLAVERQPDAIIGVDYGVFNLRFGHAIRQYVRKHSGIFQSWNPKIIQYVSPQVWASREGRAYRIARDYDLLLCLFPFEKEWYAKRVPRLHVEFVGHSMVDRYSNDGLRQPGKEVRTASAEKWAPQLLLLPGSRTNELRRHLPAMLGALKLIQEKQPGLRANMVLPSEMLAQLAKSMGTPTGVEIQVGGLPAALARADVAVASTGTVTMECACFGVPAVTLYKTSWINYRIAKAIATVDTATMPNLLAKEEVYPEFIQHQATPENISRAALALLGDAHQRAETKAKLAKIIASLGGPGASRRAAHAVTQLLAGQTAGS